MALKVLKVFLNFTFFCVHAWTPIKFVQSIIVKRLRLVCIVTIVKISIVLCSDLELLNCEKLERIREYVKQHGVQTGNIIKFIHLAQI